MTIVHFLEALFAVGLSATVALFRKGGVYNPVASTDNETVIALKTPIPENIATSSSPLQKAPVEAVLSQPRVSVEQFCTYIRDYEGKPGALNYQLNNPLDCRPSPVGYLAKYGHVEIIDTDTDPRYLYHKGKFAKFFSYEIGWEYGVNMIHFIAVNHPNWTILDLMQHFAPTSDGNAPLPYANNLAKRSGVPVDTTLQNLFA